MRSISPLTPSLYYLLFFFLSFSSISQADVVIDEGMMDEGGIDQTVIDKTVTDRSDVEVANSPVEQEEAYRTDLPPALNDEGWDLKLERNGVQIYTRDWPGSDFIAFKAKQRIESGLGNIVANFLDIATFPDWVKDMVDAYEVTPFNQAGERVTYMRMGLPWPLADRDVVSGQRVLQDSETKVVQINEWYAGDMIPVEPGVVRTPKVNNQMVLIPVNSEVTTMVWQGHTEPGGYIPSFIVNFLLESVFYESVMNMKRRFESPEFFKSSNRVQNFM